MQMSCPFLNLTAGLAINCMGPPPSPLRSSFYNSKYIIIGTFIKYMCFSVNTDGGLGNSIHHTWEIYTAVHQWLISLGKLISVGSRMNTDHCLLCKYWRYGENEVAITSSYMWQLNYVFTEVYINSTPGIYEIHTWTEINQLGSDRGKSQVKCMSLRSFSFYLMGVTHRLWKLDHSSSRIRDI